MDKEGIDYSDKAYENGMMEIALKLNEHHTMKRIFKKFILNTKQIKGLKQLNERITDKHEKFLKVVSFLYLR